MIMTIAAGERYRRCHAPRDYVWVTGVADGSVGIRHPGGLASIPQDRFERDFTPAPKRRKRGE